MGDFLFCGYNLHIHKETPGRPFVYSYLDTGEVQRLGTNTEERNGSQEGGIKSVCVPH